MTATNAAPQLEQSVGQVTSVRWRRIVPAIFSFWVVGLLDKFAVGIIVTTKPFLSEMSLTGNFALIGVLTSIVVISQAVGAFPFAYLTDKWGPRKTAILGETMRLLSTILFACAPNLLILLLARLILGFGEGHCMPVANSLNARWFNMRERAQGRSYWLAAMTVGPGLSGYIVGSILQVSTWRGAFWCLAGISAIVWILVFSWVRDDPAKDIRVSPSELAIIQSKSELDVKVAQGSSGSKLGTLDYWLAVFSLMAMSVGIWAWAAWLPSYFAHVKHLNLAMTKNYLLLAYAVGLVTNLALGRFIDRTQRRGLLATLSYSGCAILVLIVGFARSSPGILLLVCVVGLSYGVCQPTAQGFIDRISLPRRMGLESGIMNGINNIVASIGPVLMGYLIGVAHGGYQYAFLFLVCIYLISASACAGLMRRGY